MKRTILVLSLLLVACGRQEEASPFTPWWNDAPASMAPAARPATAQLSLRYQTDIAGVMTDCLVQKTVNSADLAPIYQRYCDEGPCTLRRAEGHPYPEFVFVMTSIPVDPSDTVPGACQWNLPEAI